MTRSLARALLLGALALVLGLSLAACGGDDEDEGGDGNGAVGTPAANQKRGGTLKVLASGDVDYLDPGAAYYQFTYMASYAMQRPLYSPKWDDVEQPTADFAADQPEIAADGKQITIKTRTGVRYSPPPKGGEGVDREANARDVKYAMERAFTKNVANGYAQAYCGDLVGVKEFQEGDADEIEGITNPDDNTIVLRFTKGTAGGCAGALQLPFSAPVPKEYAQKFDRKNPSTYDRNQLSTGPYMLDSYQPGKRLQLKRNPNWNRAAGKDYRPAYLDRIDFREGVDPAVGTRQILNGTSSVNGDFTPPPAELKRAVQRHRSQIAFAGGTGYRHIAMNTKEKPFDNENVRKAVAAAMDRNALRLTRGGPAVGDIATHYIPPGVPGFEEGGGMAGPKDVDFLKNPNGDLDLAKEYMKKAGAQGVPVTPDGLYAGKEEIRMVGVNEGVGAKTAQVAEDQFEKLGFKVTLRQVTTDTMYTKFCNVPEQQPPICPNVGWIKDFNDGQSLLDPTFNGDAIDPEANSNWPQLNDPAINKAIEEAKLIADPGERARKWGEVDQMVTRTAAAVPWIWDKQPNVQSRNVHGVVSKTNANWDLNFTSLK